MKKSRFRRLLPLCLLLALVILFVQPFTVVSAAENVYVIKAGTYRFNDVLSFPIWLEDEDFFHQPLQFTTRGVISVDQGTSEFLEDEGFDLPVGDYIVNSEAVRLVFASLGDYFRIFYSATFYFDDVVYSDALRFLMGSGGNLLAYDGLDDWANSLIPNGQTITISNDSEVTSEFYEWFIANAEPVIEQNIGSISLYDYPGVTQIGVVDDLVFPVQVAVVRDGLQFTNNGSDVVNFVWQFTGTGKFQGVNIKPLSPSVDIEIGRVFTLDEPTDLYITIAGDKPSYPVGSLTFFDYSGKTEIGFLDDLDVPATVKIVSNGIEVYFPYSTVPDAFYPFTGTGEFVGVNLWPNSAYLHYPIGSEFTLQGNYYLYVVISDNIVDDELGQLIGDINNGPPGAQDKVDQFDKDMQDKLDGILNGSNKLDGLTPARPNLDGNLNLDPNAILNAGPLIATIWTIDGLMPNFVMLIVILAVGYVFFGKKE